MNPSNSNNNYKKILSFETIFIITSLTIIFLNWLAVLFVELQIFYKSILIATIALIAFSILVFLRNKKIEKLSGIDFIVLVVILFFALFNTFYAHGTFFGGRDDGMYANTATYIAKNHTFYIKNPVAISFPGHVETQSGIILPFYMGYPSWLAINITLFGIDSVRYSNFILIVIGLLSLYFVGKKIAGSKIGLITVVALATTYPMFWFTRRTFSENLAFVLIWFGILCFLNAYEKKRNKYLIPAIISFGLFLAVRVESIPLFLMFILLLLFLTFVRKERWIFSKMLVAVCLVSVFPAIWYNTIIDTHYITTFVAYAKNFLFNIFAGGLTSTTNSDLLKTTLLNKNALEYNISSINWKLLSLYNFFFVILFIPIAFLKKLIFSFKKNNNLILFVFFLTSPQLFYLFNPSISLDQPWFLRRFLLILLPVSFLSFGYVIKDLSKKLMLLTASLIIIGNILISLPILTFREFNGVINQVQQIEETNIRKNRDLILVDYSTVGDYKIAEPLFYVFDYNSVAVLGYSIKNLLSGSDTTEPTLYVGGFKIPEICGYDDIYILTNTRDNRSIKNQFDNESLIGIEKGINLNYTQIARECELPRLTKSKTTSEIPYLNIHEVEEFCQNRSENFHAVNLHLDIYLLTPQTVKDIKSRYCK